MIQDIIFQPPSLSIVQSELGDPVRTVSVFDRSYAIFRFPKEFGVGVAAFQLDDEKPTYAGRIQLMKISPAHVQQLIQLFGVDATRCQTSWIGIPRPSRGDITEPLFDEAQQFFSEQKPFYQLDYFFAEEAETVERLDPYYRRHSYNRLPPAFGVAPELAREEFSAVYGKIWL